VVLPGEIHEARVRIDATIMAVTSVTPTKNSSNSDFVDAKIGTPALKNVQVTVQSAVKERQPAL